MSMKLPVTKPTGTTAASATIAPGTSKLLDASPLSASRSTCPRTLDSHDILGEQALVLIRHLGEIYRLQTTRQGKLILTK